MDIWRLLGLREASTAERRATFWVGAMFFLSLAATFVLRPLRDQFGVDRGVGQLPYLYSLTLLATVVVVVPFWWLADRMASRRFVPLMLHVFTLGLLALAGSIVNNGIVMIDKIETNRREGQTPYDAVVSSAVSRFRPILLSVSTTMLGFLPLIVNRDPLFYGMASVMFFGLGIGSMFTLNYVPALYAIFFRVKIPASKT